jgi:predicted small metal-binding protein
MTKVLRCADFMPGCDYEAHAESEGELAENGTGVN